MKPGKIDPSWFYARFLDMGSRDNRPMLIPLSFTLPAIVYVRTPTDVQNMFMPLDTLQSRSQDFNKANKSGRSLPWGFLPSWNSDFLTETALLFGARFRPGRNGLPAFDESGLDKTVDFAAFMGGQGERWPAAGRRVRRPQPRPALVQAPVIREDPFALASFTEFFALPEEKRRDFDFRWLSQDDLIPVMDNALFAGVLRSPATRRGADVPAVVLQPRGPAEPPERQPVENGSGFSASPTAFRAEGHQ